MTFFKAQIDAHGIGATMEKYIFDASSNANGTAMLGRLVSGA